MDDRPKGIIRKRGVVGSISAATKTRIKRAGEFSWSKATDADTLYDGDSVKTAAGGRAIVRRRDGSYDGVAPSSLMEMRVPRKQPPIKTQAPYRPPERKKLTVKSRPVRQTEANTFPKR